MEFSTLTMKDFGNVMRHLKVLGKSVLDEKKEIIQGILLFAVAFAHAQEDELSIGIGMLSRVLEKLGTSPSVYNSIDVDRIRNKAVEMQQANNLVMFEI